MLHTIQADFYRLFRSKGFWITEAILIFNIFAGVLFGAIGHVGVNTGDTPVQSTEVWNGFTALINYSSSLSFNVLLTIVIITLVLGVDLNQKLYKNSLSYGVSRFSYYFAKTAVVTAIALFQMLLTYGIVFTLGVLYHGMGTAPAHFLPNFLLTLAIQLICSLAWISIVNFILYASQSIAVAFVAYFLGNMILSLPTVLFPKIEIFRYFTLDFGYDLIQNNTATFNITLVAICFFALFTSLGLAVFQRKDL